MKHVTQLGIYIMLTLLLITSCSSTDSFKKNEPFDTNKLKKFEVTNNEAEVTEGDYIFKLVSEKEIYEVEERVELYGEITYRGDKEEVVIEHLSKLFLFPMNEKVREHEITDGTTAEAIETKLTQDKPYQEKYAKNGVGYAEEDPQAYQSFIENFISREDFPAGYYEVHGEADFYVGGEHINLKAIIDFKVIK